MKERVISVTDFKAQCLSLLDDVASTGEAVVITKRGKPLARVVQIKQRRRPLMGGMAGTAEEVGDIVHFDTSDLWECLK